MKKYISIIALLLSANIFAQNKQVKVYPFKSAIIEYKLEGGSSGTHTKYIDDYGFKQADYISSEINGDKKQETIILVGERAYTIEYKEDTTVAIGPNSAYIYYLQNQDKTCVEVSEAYLKAANSFNQNGTKNYLGKECKVWSINDNTFYTYKGLQVYSEINFFMMMVEKATSIKIDVEIPKDKFEISQGAKYISSDHYQGYAGLELNFDNNSIKKSDNPIKVNFNSSDLESPETLPYYTQEGEKVIQDGANDFNKVDFKIIKSQASQLQSNTIELGKYRTVIFIQKDSYGKGNNSYGKLQINNIRDKNFSYRYMIFDEDENITGYSNSSNNALENIFKITTSKNNNNLILTPKSGTKSMVLGW